MLKERLTSGDESLNRETTEEYASRLVTGRTLVAMSLVTEPDAEYTWIDRLDDMYVARQEVWAANALPQATL
jgi:hypothetical protein